METSESILIGELAVAHHHAADIHRHEAVAPQIFHAESPVGEPVGQQNDADADDIIKAVIVKIDIVEIFGGKFADDKSQQNPDSHAHRESPEDRPVACRLRTRNHINHEQCQESCHRVVASRLIFEQRLEFPFQADAFAAQNREDRRSVGGGND